MKKYFVPFFMILLMAACKDNDNVNLKQRMYPHIEYPKEVSYTSYSQNCPFTFVYPNYFKIEKDTSDINGNKANPCSFNLRSESLNATIYCTYLPIKSKNDLSEYIGDAFDATDEHNIKANNRRESVIKTKTKNVNGILFEVGGEVATPIQFYITDSTKHYMRASLYFESKVKQDSTAPILKYLEKDLFKMIDTWSWK